VFLHPLGLLALAAIPAIVAVYYFRRRFQPKTVSALFLWEVRDRVPAAGRRFERLRSSSSLWLEVLAALFLGLAFAGLRGFGVGETSHLVIVLDGSASMEARAGNTTFRERALAVARERIAALPRRASVTVVRSAPAPSILAGPGAFPAEAAEKLGSFVAAAPHHDVSSAVALALQLAGGGSVLLVTNDFRPDAYPESVEIVSVGQPLSNVAITSAARTREKTFVTLANHGGGAARGRFVVSAAGRAVHTSELEIAPGDPKNISLELPKDAPAIEARFEAARAEDDALAADSRVFLAPPPSRTILLASTLTSEAAADLGIASGEGGSSVDRLLSIVPDSRQAVDSTSAHLLFTNDPKPNDRAWTLSLEAPGKDRADLIGPFLTEKRHPLMEGLTLQGLVWSADPNHVPAGAPVVSAGNRPLLTETRDGERRVFRMNLDPARSTIRRSPDWPILLVNLAEMRRAALPGAARTNLTMGEPFIFRAPGDAKYRVDGPGGAREVRGRATLVVDGLWDAGLHTLTRLPARAGEREEPLCEFAVSFCDPALSDLRELRGGTRPAKSALANVSAESTWIDAALLLASLACLCLDWTLQDRARRRMALAI
jgi:hypothetical protein